MRTSYPMIAVMLSAILAFAMTGCSDSSAPRSVLHVVSVNDNQPLQSDVASGPDSALSIAEDIVTIQIVSLPHDPALNLTQGEPFGYVMLDTYDIEYTSDEAIPSVHGTLGWTVHSGETITGDLVIVPAELKVQPPLVSLRHGGEIICGAHITIHAREATTNYAYTVEGDLPINFANWAD